MGFEPDRTKAYAFTLLLVDNGIMSNIDLLKYTEGYEKLKGGYYSPLSLKQLKQGEVFKEQWAKTHSSPIYGYNKLTNVHNPD